MRSLAVVAAAGFVLMSLACGGGGASQKEMVEFQDHAERFKGKTLTFRLSATAPAGGTSARDHPGKPLDFHAYAGSGILRMKVIMPDDTKDVPNLMAGDEALVTFTCQAGKLDEGNRAVKIVRP